MRGSARRFDGFPLPLNSAATVPANRNTMKLMPQRPVAEAIWISGRKSICVYARLPHVLCGDATAVRYSHVTQEVGKASEPRKSDPRRTKLRVNRTANPKTTAG